MVFADPCCLRWARSCCRPARLVVLVTLLVARRMLRVCAGLERLVASVLMSSCVWWLGRAMVLTSLRLRALFGRMMRLLG